eukprot:scaffold26451_cov31-Attheya_sp.AAC.1
MIASTLCNYRREAFSASPSLKNELLVESLKDVPSTASMVEDRKEVVQHSFLAFVETAKSERLKILPLAIGPALAKTPTYMLGQFLSDFIAIFGVFFFLPFIELCDWPGAILNNFYIKRV